MKQPNVRLAQLVRVAMFRAIANRPGATRADDNNLIHALMSGSQRWACPEWKDKQKP